MTVGLEEEDVVVEGEEVWSGRVFSFVVAVDIVDGGGVPVSYAIVTRYY